MARYIDADLLIENIAKIEDLRTLSTKTIGEAISNTPTADVEEVKHAEWLEVNHTGNSKRGRHIKYTTKKCSVCGYCNGRRRTDRCPKCGAKMDGGKE